MNKYNKNLFYYYLLLVTTYFWLSIKKKSLHISEDFLIHHIHTVVIVAPFCGCWDTYCDAFTGSHLWNCYIQLAIAKYRFWQVYPHALKCLALALIDCNCKACFNRNCLLLKVNGQFVSDRDISTLLMATFFPAWVPVTTSAWMTLLSNRVTISLVPLHWRK